MSLYVLNNYLLSVCSVLGSAGRGGSGDTGATLGMQEEACRAPAPRGLRGQQGGVGVLLTHRTR